MLICSIAWNILVCRVECKLCDSITGNGVLKLFFGMIFKIKNFTWGRRLHLSQTHAYLGLLKSSQDIFLMMVEIVESSNLSLCT
jgi:hypothetical protein